MITRMTHDDDINMNDDDLNDDETQHVIDDMLIDIAILTCLKSHDANARRVFNYDDMIARCSSSYDDATQQFVIKYECAITRDNLRLLFDANDVKHNI